MAIILLAFGVFLLLFMIFFCDAPTSNEIAENPHIIGYYGDRVNPEG